MANLMRLGLALTGMAFSGARTAGPDEGYHHEEPLAGSLKSDKPLPLYDKDPQHLCDSPKAKCVMPGSRAGCGTPALPRLYKPVPSVSRESAKLSGKDLPDILKLDGGHGL